jgi:hypothetical protein
MRVRTTPADILLRLPLQREQSEQGATFRQALTALAQSTTALNPPALDGVDQVALEAAAHIAIEKGFADKLDSDKLIDWKHSC